MPGDSIRRRHFHLGWREITLALLIVFLAYQVVIVPTTTRSVEWSRSQDADDPFDPFQVVSRGAPGRLSRQDVGWKDTVAVRPSETVEVAVRFTDYAGRYVVHCHNLLGRVYILVIAPFHGQVVKASLRRAARVGWPKAVTR